MSKEPDSSPENQSEQESAIPSDKNVKQAMDRYLQEKQDKEIEKETKKASTRFKPTKLMGFSAKRVEHTYFDDKGRKFAYIQERRQKPYSTEVRILPKAKKNPDKDVIASIGEFPYKSQIFQYKTSDEYIYISNGVDMVRLERKDFFKMILQVLGSTVLDKNMEQDLMDADLWLQIFSKSKLPHLKLKDWRKEQRIITLTPELLDKEFVENIRDKEEAGRKLL